MAQYDWTTCPGPVRTQIQTFCKQAHIILSDELVSIYLHGSLAMGCFNPEQSDIDLLVVTHQRMSIETKRQLMDLLPTFLRNVSSQRMRAVSMALKRFPQNSTHLFVKR